MRGMMQLPFERHRLAVAIVALLVAGAAGASGVTAGNASSSATAASRVTIAAMPAVAASDHPVTLFGTVPSGRPGELVEIQAKECGQSFFRAVSTTHSQSGGRWTAEFFPGITSAVRASWKSDVSKPVFVKQRAMLRFAAKAFNRTRFVVSVVARAQFWRRYVAVERYDRDRKAWRPFRRVVLTEQNAPGSIVWTSGEFTARTPRGTMLRAVLPTSQAAPCYLTSTSLTVRT